MLEFDRDTLLREAVIDGECNCYRCRIGRLNKIAQLKMQAIFKLDKLPRCCHMEAPYFRYLGLQGHDILTSMQNISQYVEKLQSHRTTKLKTAVCSDCGYSHKEESMKTLVVYGEKETISVCPDCLKQYYWCAECNNATYARNPTWRPYDTKEGKLCHKCFSKKYDTCQCCGNYKLRNELTDFYQMDGYDRTGIMPHMHYMICKDCISKLVSKCASCNTLILTHNSGKIDINGKRQYVCRDCQNLQTREIQRFDYKPKRFPKLVGSKESHPRDDTLLFGVEVEMEPISERFMYDSQRQDMAKLMLEYFGRHQAMVKHDGTVSYGIEVVSFPFSWAWLKENKSLWEGFFQLMSSKNHTCEKGITGNAGFHVHMTKGAFNTYHLFKYLKFIYNVDHQDFVKIVSDRKKNWQYCAFLDKDRDSMPKIAKCKLNTSKERHSAISLMYQPTVELRIFGGTDTYRGFMKNLEFCLSTYEFTRDYPMAQLTSTDYVKFLRIRNNEHRFPNLVKFLQQSRKLAKVCRLAHKLITEERD